MVDHSTALSLGRETIEEEVNKDQGQSVGGRNVIFQVSPNMVLRDKVLSMPGIPTDTNTMGSPTGTSSALLGRQLEVLLNDMDTQQKARIFQDFIIKTYRERE
jgi:hypothetical protein